MPDTQCYGEPSLSPRVLDGRVCPTYTSTITSRLGLVSAFKSGEFLRRVSARTRGALFRGFAAAEWGSSAPYCWDVVCHGADLPQVFHPDYPQVERWGGGGGGHGVRKCR